MTNHTLNNIDPEDIEDWLARVEKSFNIRFAGQELVGIKTFGELCDHIAGKVSLDHQDDCTTQQAFYKLRNAVTSALTIKDITPATILTDILPRKKRIQRIREIERELGFRLFILKPPDYVLPGLTILLIASLISLFISSRTGALGALTTIMGFWLASKLGKELSCKTVGKVAQKMARENYLRSRRNATTLNRTEIGKILAEWFSEDLDVPKANLTRDATFS